jgi:hypothetical protein
MEVTVTRPVSRFFLPDAKVGAGISALIFRANLVVRFSTCCRHLANCDMLLLFLVASVVVFAFQLQIILKIKPCPRACFHF